MIFFLNDVCLIEKNNWQADKKKIQSQYTMKVKCDHHQDDDS